MLWHLEMINDLLHPLGSGSFVQSDCRTTSTEYVHVRSNVYANEKLMKEKTKTPDTQKERKQKSTVGIELQNQTICDIHQIVKCK